MSVGGSVFSGKRSDDIPGAMSWAFLETMKHDHNWNMSYIQVEAILSKGKNVIDETPDPDANSRPPPAAICASPTAFSWLSIRSQSAHEDLR